MHGVASVALFLCSSIATASPALEGRFIDVELRNASGDPVTLPTIDLDALPLRAIRAHDAQYGKDAHVLGLPLSEVLGSLLVPPAYDLALLRFDNGLVIPVDFRDAQLMARLAPIVARASTTDFSATLVTGQIEAAQLPPTPDDLRLVGFGGNKIVVADATLANVLPSAAKDLRPWLYAGSLTSIDLVSRVVWERLLYAGAKVRDGQRVFGGTCVFCHAVRGYGGALGLDLADASPIYARGWKDEPDGVPEVRQRIPAKTRFDIHVRFRAGDGGSRTMPAMRGMAAAEVTDVWKWIIAFAALPLPVR